VLLRTNIHLSELKTLPVLSSLFLKKYFTTKNIEVFASQLTFNSK